MVTLPIDKFIIRADANFHDRTVVMDIRCVLGEEVKAEMQSLIGLGADQLEVVIRRRAPSPQEVQSAANAARATAYGRLEPKTTKKAVKSDAPETQPEPEEPTTAQLVEEFGSWG